MVDLPPPRFDHPPAIHVQVVEVDRLGLELTCRQPGLLACAKRMDDGCWVFVLEGYRGYPGLMRHELGHCNGWPADHPR